MLGKDADLWEYPFGLRRRTLSLNASLYAPATPQERRLATIIFYISKRMAWGRAATAAPETAATAPRPAAAPTKLGRFVAVRRGAPRPGFSPRGLFAGPVTIVRGTSGVADPLASQLLSRGIEVVVVDALDPKAAARVIDLSGRAEPSR